MDWNGANVRLLPVENARQITWSPDSQSLVYWSVDDQRLYTVGLNRNPQLWISAVNGEQRAISDGRYSHWSPVWWSRK